MIIQWPIKNRGMAIRPFIFTYDKDDWCLLEHERVHIKQQKYPFPFNLPWLLRWLFDKKFRKEMEDEANQRQNDCINGTI